MTNEKPRGAGSDKSSASSREDLDAIERASLPDEDAARDGNGAVEKAGSTAPTELKRVASNVLTKVASHMTTRSIVNPPPPPDGGLNAWTQVAMAWLVVFTTWGWVNSYGVSQNRAEPWRQPNDRIGNNSRLRWSILIALITVRYIVLRCVLTVFRLSKATTHSL